MKLLLLLSCYLYRACCILLSVFLYSVCHFVSVEISCAMKFFQNCVLTGFYNNNYSLFAQGAKLGNFGKFLIQEKC